MIQYTVVNNFCNSRKCESYGIFLASQSEFLIVQISPKEYEPLVKENWECGYLLLENLFDH